MEKYTWDAKNHSGKILKFDEETVFLPLHEREAYRLLHALEKSIEQLDMSGDFPEKQEYADLRSNLLTVLFALSSK